MCWAGLGKNKDSAYSGWLQFINSDKNRCSLCIFPGVPRQVEHKEPGL